MRGNPPGERCAAQPSGRPHEPSGNRRPEMDGHPPRAIAVTELGVQTASLTTSELAPSVPSRDSLTEVGARAP